MKYSLLLPTREREMLFTNAVRSLNEKTTDKSEIEILVACDDDDDNSQSYVKKVMKIYPEMNIQLFIRPRSELLNNDYINWLAGKAQGDFLWFYGDDVEMLKKGWDVVVWERYLEYKKTRPDNIICIGVQDNTPPTGNRPKFPCFLMITKEAKALFGWMVHPNPPNWGADLILYKLYSPMNRLLEINDEQYLNHISHHTNQMPDDATSSRLGEVHGRLKNIAKYNTDIVLGDEVPQLRKKMANYIEKYKSNI